jgi:hypothetical protein
MIVTGADELLGQLTSLRRGVRRIASGAVGAAAQSAVQQVRQSIKHNGVRNAIGWSYSSAAAEVASAKLGVAVGRGSKYRTQSRRRGGVGIDGRNAHWLILGTADRYTGTKRSRTGRKDTGKRKRFTGKMPPQERPIPSLLNAAGARRVLISSIRRDLDDLIEDLDAGLL